MENNAWYKTLNRSKLNPPGWVLELYGQYYIYY